MRATVPTNVSPAWRAPTWVAAVGHKRKAIVTRKQLFEPLVLFESYNHRNNLEINTMEYAAFVFGILGLVAFVRVEKLVKTLKEKGILEEDYKEE